MVVLLSNGVYIAKKQNIYNHILSISGNKADHLPKQLLPVVGLTFEEQLHSITETVIEPAGFEVVSWSRVPYLCEGDLRQSYYWLDDVLIVLKNAKC